MGRGYREEPWAISLQKVSVQKMGRGLSSKQDLLQGIIHRLNPQRGGVWGPRGLRLQYCFIHSSRPGDVCEKVQTCTGAAVTSLFKKSRDGVSGRRGQVN